MRRRPTLGPAGLLAPTALDRLAAADPAGVGRTHGLVALAGQVVRRCGCSACGGRGELCGQAVEVQVDHLVEPIAAR